MVYLFMKWSTLNNICLCKIFIFVITFNEVEFMIWVVTQVPAFIPCYKLDDMQINTDFNIYSAQELFSIRKMETFKRGIYVTTKISNVFNRFSQIVFIHKIRIQYIPYRLLNKLFYKQEKLFEIYIYSKLHINQLIKQLKQLQHSITKTFTFNIQSPKPI